MALSVRTAPLLLLDPELGRGLAAHEHVQALREGIVPVVDLASGPWSPAEFAARHGGCFALLVAAGLLMRETVVGDVVTTELVGPCDLIETVPAAHELLPVAEHWMVVDTATLVLLDRRMRLFLRRWPAIGTALIERTVAHAARDGTHRAINQMPRVEERLLAMFAYMGERWGRVGSSGIIIPIALTHEALGRLIGARRPTVSLALRELADAGAVARRDDGSWLLRFDAAQEMATGGDGRPEPAGDDVRMVEPLRPRAANARPHPSVSAAERSDMLARVAGLREAHTRRQQRIRAALARSADVRAAIAARRGRRP